MEIWDSYDKNGVKMAQDLIRGEPIPAGLYHAVSEVLLVHQDKTVLMMRRDLVKEPYPGYEEASAGGSLLKGESFRDGALRELREECGIHQIDGMESYARTRTGKTIYTGFLVRTSQSKDSVLLQEGETIAYRWVSWEDFVRFIKSDQAMPGQQKRLVPNLGKLESMLRSMKTR